MGEVQLQAVVYIRGEGGGRGGGGRGGGSSRTSPKQSCQDSPGQSFMEAKNTSSAFTSGQRCIIASSTRQYALRWRLQVAGAAFSFATHVTSQRRHMSESASPRHVSVRLCLWNMGLKKKKKTSIKFFLPNAWRKFSLSPNMCSLSV